ncbi:MAG: class I SAM-dependent methyltransferase [Solirubrobacteraceae bacterium]
MAEPRGVPGERENDADDSRAREIREAAQRQWGHDPAGAIVVGGEPLGTPESFREVERHRYAEQPWMHDTFGYERFAGQRVLEIGVGLGTDHLQFARAGAVTTGVDLTPRCIELTRRRFEQEGLESVLRVMDAEQLEFADSSFDAVYSFGVLHHVPSAERAFSEVRRVLRPGGVFLGALYNRYSLFVATRMAIRAVRGEWRKESVEDRLSRVEHSTASTAPKPYVRLFTVRELRDALRVAGFHQVEIVKRHHGLNLKLVRIPASLDKFVGRHAGWYLVHRAS